MLRQPFPECRFECVSAIQQHFRRSADPKSVAAAVVEPVLGEGGFVATA
jgi:4-aminobutyrate aminotransferase-like enzyme